MKILGIDTTSKYLCLGIYDNGKVYEHTVKVERKLSELLAPTIKRVLACLHLEVRDIDYFACGRGPGSFTGIRIGLSMIKGLSWSVKKPVVGVPTLDILALNARSKSAYIIPLVDAKRNMLYTSAYKTDGRSLKKLKPDMLLTVEEFIRVSKKDALFLGDGLGVCKDKILAKIPQAVILDKDYWYPNAFNLITLALTRIKKKQLHNPFDILPIYLYPKECQIRNRNS